MPVSNPVNIPIIMQEIVRLQPAGVIELGIGCGLYGALCRNYLDGVKGKVSSKQWQTVLWGIEGFKAYKNPLWRVYDRVAIADFRQHYQSISGWDLVLMVDSLEHVEKSQAHHILSTLLKNNKHVLICVPRGEYPQGEVHGNDLEKHLSSWDIPDFLVSDFDGRISLKHGSGALIASIKGEQ